MASDDKKTKPTPKAEAVAPKKDAAPAKDKIADAAKPDAAKPDAAKPDAAKPDAAKPDAAKPDASKPETSKSESSEASATPKSYSRGEGQKPVSQAYKDNWNAIFGKKAKKKKR
jgi:hypothetical protein